MSNEVLSLTDKSDSDKSGRPAHTPRPLRTDAQRSETALLEAALAVFATSGVDAPVREIAEKAGVGIATLYRRFPQRSDLIVAVFRQQVDACADAAAVLATKHEPAEALAQWMHRYAEFLAAKRGLAAALHSGDPAFNMLPAYFYQLLRPALQELLNSAATAGQVRNDIQAYDLLRAVGNLCCTPTTADETGYVRRMVALLVDGLRFNAGTLVEATSMTVSKQKNVM